MLRDVIGAYLDTVTEREFDAPLLAMLAARGFTDVHFLHGTFEFGKDMVAKGLKPPGSDAGSGDPATWVLHQFAIQSKAGDMGATGWREVRPQMDEARLDGLAHPAFDNNLPRAGVLVITGRLKGNAAIQAQSYRQQETSRGRPDFEIWDRETLIEWLVDAPEAGLAGVSDGPMLALAGAIDDHTANLSDLEQHARSWLPPVPGTLTATTTTTTQRRVQLRRASIEAAVLVNRMRRNRRLDLAAITALMLLRAAWCHHGADGTELPNSQMRPAMAETAARLFAACATELLDQVEPAAADPRELIRRTAGSPLRYATYPATCSRVAEVLGLLGLFGVGYDRESPAAFSNIDRAGAVVHTLLANQPGCAHPISDSFAVGLLAPIMVVAKRDIDAAALFLERTAVWIADRYDEAGSGIGLASPLSSPQEEVEQLFGGPHEKGPQRRRTSYLGTIILDLAAALPGQTALYRGVLNEFEAVDLVPQLLVADEEHAQWRPDGPGAQIFAPVQYRDRSGTEPFANHHSEPLILPLWDSIALASVVRNRHHGGAVREFFTQLQT